MKYQFINFSSKVSTNIQPIFIHYTINANCKYSETSGPLLIFSEFMKVRMYVQLKKNNKFNFKIIQCNTILIFFNKYLCMLNILLLKT